MRIPGIAELLRPAADGLTVEDHRPATGREAHPQKITVYLSADELLDLEHARLRLLGFGISADRGRLVREAIAVLLADLDARGEASVLATRLRRDLAGRDAAAPDAADGGAAGQGMMNRET